MVSAYIVNSYAYQHLCFTISCSGLNFLLPEVHFVNYLKAVNFVTVYSWKTTLVFIYLKMCLLWAHNWVLSFPLTVICLSTLKIFPVVFWFLSLWLKRWLMDKCISFLGKLYFSLIAVRIFLLGISQFHNGVSKCKFIFMNFAWMCAYVFWEFHLFHKFQTNSLL